MKYKKTVTLFTLATVPAAVVLAPSTETQAAATNDTFAYYIGNTYYSNEVTYVEALIDEINPSSTSFNYQVQRAQNAYENLTNTQKAQISNAHLLFKYINTYTDYETIVNTFRTKMNAISIYNSTFIRDVEQANRYYNSLNSIEKSYISSYLVRQLNNYVTNIADMRDVEAKFEALSVYDSNYQSQYLAAMKAFNALPLNYRNLIATKAEEKRKENTLYYSIEFNRSAAQKVIIGISKLSTTSTPTEVQQVRDLYNKLTDYQQSFVKNIEDLVYIEDVLNKPELGWDPYYYDDSDEEDEQGIKITKNGNTYSVDVPISEMKRYTPTTITVSDNVKLKLDRSAIPNYNDTATIAMAIDEYDGNSIVFTASVNNEDVVFKDFVEIELKGLPSNAIILRIDKTGKVVATPYKKNGTKYTIKTKTSAEFVVSTENVNFYDINTDGNRYYIEQLAKHKIISGVKPNYYQPKASISIGQYAVMIARAMNLSATKNATYVDVKGKWFDSAIQALLEANILDHKNGMYFYPNKIVTRQEAAKISVRMLKESGIALPEVDYRKVPFKDFNKVSASDRYYVAIAYQLGVFGGNSNGNFDPNKPLTRSQMAKVLYTTLQLANKL